MTAPFHPLLFRVILVGVDAVQPNLHELEAFDPREAHSCRRPSLLRPLPPPCEDAPPRRRQLLAMEDAEMLCLEFEPQGQPCQDVTNANRHEYVRWRAHDVLLGRRRTQFEALRRGFNTIPLQVSPRIPETSLPSYPNPPHTLQAHLRLFSSTQLMALLCGAAVLDPELVVARLKFSHFPVGGATEDRFKSVVRALSEQELRQFLAFVTASAALPRGEESDRYYYITIQHKHGGDDDFPMAHTCFNRLDLPAYSSQELMRTRLLFCLEHLQDAGFGEA